MAKLILCGLVITVIVFSSGRAECAITVTGELDGDEIMEVNELGHFTNSGEVESGEVFTSVLTTFDGGWKAGVKTGVAWLGGYTLPASAYIRVELDRSGQLIGSALPTHLSINGRLTGNVTTEFGGENWHDGSLFVAGHQIVSEFGDLFFLGNGSYLVDIPFSVQVPVSETGTFPSGFRIVSESNATQGIIVADFSTTLEITSITLLNGASPESEGVKLNFGAGIRSPNAKYFPLTFANSYNHNIQTNIQSFPTGDIVLGGVPFEIPDGNNQYRSFTDGLGMHIVEVDADLYGVREVYALMNTNAGLQGQSFTTVEFIGSGGAYFSKSLIDGDDVRDYNLHPGWATTINGLTTIEVFREPNGVDGNPDVIDMVIFELPEDFFDERLETIRFKDTAVSGHGMLLTGITAGLFPIRGDYNSDGAINAADYTVWRDGGSPDSTRAGYDLWKANFGNSGSGTNAAVPEPSTVALLLIASLVGIWRAGVLRTLLTRRSSQLGSD